MVGGRGSVRPPDPCPLFSRPPSSLVCSSRRPRLPESVLRHNPRAGTTGARAIASQPAASDSAVDPILDALHDRGQTLKDFTANVELSETDPAVGDTTKRIGQVMYEKKNGGQLSLFDPVARAAAKQTPTQRAATLETRPMSRESVGQRFGHLATGTRR